MELTCLPVVCCSLLGCGFIDFGDGSMMVNLCSHPDAMYPLTLMTLLFTYMVLLAIINARF